MVSLQSKSSSTNEYSQLKKARRGEKGNVIDQELGLFSFSFFLALGFRV